MNELTWMITNDAPAMLEHLFGVRSPDSLNPDPRPIWLYLLACSRKIWDRIPAVMRSLLEVAELIATNQPLDLKLKVTAREAAEELIHHRDPEESRIAAEQILRQAGHAIEFDTGRVPFDEKAWASLAHLVYFSFSASPPIFQRIDREFLCADRVREVFGNPFVPMPPPQVWAKWLTSDVRGLIRYIEQNRDFSTMLRLADALEEAGCENKCVLDHCRGPNLHISSCWVFDNLLHASNRFA